MRPLLLAAALLAACAPARAALPAGTPVLTLTGSSPIEKIKTGDKVLAFSGEKLVQAEVRDAVESKARLLKVRTAKGSLTATADHPLLTYTGFTELRSLQKGDSVALLNDGRKVWAKILSIKPAGTAPVYGLELAPPHTFIAGGFIVHNRYYRSSYRRRGGGLFDLVFLGAVGLVMFIKQLFGGTAGGRTGRPSFRPAEPRSRLLENGPVNLRAERTLEIMKALGARDPAFNPVELENFARKVFVKAQSALKEREYSGMAGLLMPSLLRSLEERAQALKVRGERRLMEDLQILHADFVHVRCPREREGRSFTVLFTASARDYTLSDRSNRVVSGGLDPRTFQEFWTFHQFNGSWALARVDQVGELDFVNAPNLPDSPQGAAGVPLAAGGTAAVPEMPGRPRDHSAYMPPGMAPQAPDAVPAALAAAPDYPAAAQPPQPELPRRFGAPPPLAAAGAGQKPAAARPAAQPDHWNRQKMEIAATLAFESVYEAWGRNDAALLSGDFVSAEALARLKKLFEARRAEGLSFEFRSLFVRRAEVVLTSPAEKSPLKLDEFTARINATALRALQRKGKTLCKDEAPEPFTEYWVFGRQDKSWKLRDILPRMEQSGEDLSKDGAPGPTQIEWYWSAEA